VFRARYFPRFVAAQTLLYPQYNIMANEYHLVVRISLFARKHRK